MFIDAIMTVVAVIVFVAAEVSAFGREWCSHFARRAPLSFEFVLFSAVRDICNCNSAVCVVRRELTRVWLVGLGGLGGIVEALPDQTGVRRPYVDRITRWPCVRVKKLCITVILTRLSNQK